MFLTLVMIILTVTSVIRITAVFMLNEVESKHKRVMMSCGSVVLLVFCPLFSS